MNEYWKNKKITLTGGGGFLGSFIYEKLIDLGVSKRDILVPRSVNYDLRKKEDCQKVCKGKNIVIHLAANVGGIGYNQQYPGNLFYDNIMMCTHMMEEARKANVEKYVALGTICSYPKYTPVPFKEEELWFGYPEETNAPYGLAKKMQLVQSQSYRQQYDFNSIFLLPVNLYGPRDEFNPNRSHVIPALIRKFTESKESVIIWGTGKATREFLYVEDAVNAIILATEKYNKSEPVNIGSGFEISIMNLVKTIAELTDFNGEIVWDDKKPDGQPRRKLDVSKAKEEFGFKAKTTLVEGLKKTIKWWKEQ